MPLSALLPRLVAAFQTRLGEHLVGLYVHGSIAFGCFTWARSDVDLIAVVESSLTDDQCLGLLHDLLVLSQDAPPKGIEMSVVLRAHCGEFVYPTPYELHFSPMWAEAARRDPRSLIHRPRGTDIDLAAHFTVMRAVGHPLCGAPVDQVFGPVPGECYLASILEDVGQAREDIVGNPVYVALNLCRVLAYVRDGAVLSKPAGGRWGLAHLPEKYRPVIQAALADYTCGTPMPRDPAAEDAFAKYMLDAIRAVP